MNVSNITQRRPRKSLLGTNRIKRESILPILPDSLFSIHEETLKNYQDVVPAKDDVHLICEERKSHSPVLLDQSSVSETTSNDNNISVDSVYDFKEDKQLSPLRKRLDSFFSPSIGSNDDSFIAHETMIANDESILATTLVPQNESLDANNFTILSNVTIAETATTNSDAVCSSKTVHENSNNNVTQNETEECEKADVKIFLKLIDSMIDKNAQLVITYNQQVEELQKKIDESNKENEEIRKMKRVLTKHFNVDKKDTSGKENVDPSTPIQDTAVKNSSSRGEARLKIASPVVSPSKQIIQEMRSTIKYLKTPRMSRAPRQSLLLTPHSMTFSIKSQYEKLLE